jgi:ATPase subunit of ABC transporter with duplicated ATPase domains
MQNVDLGVDLDSRVAIVGENGAGKSTFLKLLTTEITPTHGHVSRHPKLRLATFKQHHSDMLDLEMSAVDYFRSVWIGLVHIGAAVTSLGSPMSRANGIVLFVSGCLWGCGSELVLQMYPRKKAFSRTEHAPLTMF